MARAYRYDPVMLSHICFRQFHTISWGSWHKALVTQAPDQSTLAKFLGLLKNSGRKYPEPRRLQTKSDTCARPLSGDRGIDLPLRLGEAKPCGCFLGPPTSHVVIRIPCHPLVLRSLLAPSWLPVGSRPYVLMYVSFGRLQQVHASMCNVQGISRAA